MATRSVAHSNVVIHVDIDYFYAQVEEVMNPELKDKPFGIQQGLNMVTCNYIARSYGIKKWRPMKECLEKCPELVVVNGEDLSNYKVYSKKIAELLHAIIGPSERMGLDEHYLDITKLVEERMSQEELKNIHMTCPIYPNEATFAECSCGCEQRLVMGSKIAQSIREKLFEDLKLTCSVGISHNKLLAKLVGQVNKPNNQTVLAPTAAAVFMRDLKDLRSIMGVGGRTASRIEELGIGTIEDLQNCDIEKLAKAFTVDTAKRLKELAMGVDVNAVKPSEKAKTVGLEDSLKPTTNRAEIEENFRDLLPRLVWQIREDSRIPQAIRVTVRKYDLTKKASIRETKQFALLPSHFQVVEGLTDYADGAEDKIMKHVMMLFDRMVDFKQKLFVNLVGLCFCKLQDQKRGAGSIACFLTRPEDQQKTEKQSQVVRRLLESSDIEGKLEPPAKRVKIDDHVETTLQIPANVDPTVWCDLPPDIQQELLRTWQPSAPQATAASSASTIKPSQKLKPKMKETNSKEKLNTLYNHFAKQ